MRIKELADKYKMNVRTIDYYTTLDLIPYEQDNEKNNYRDYGEEAEAVVRKIRILRDVGLTERQIKDALTNPSYFTTKKWNELIKNMQDKVEDLKRMIDLATAIRDTESRTLSTVNKFQERIQWELFTKGMAKGIKMAETMMKEDNESDDINDVLEKAYGFGMKMENKQEKGLTADSDEVQGFVEKFLFRIVDDYYGTVVYMLLSSCSEFLPAMMMDEDETPEEIDMIKKMLAIGGEWFYKHKSVKECADFEKFKVEYKDQIAELDSAIKESTTEGFEELITEICRLPNTLTGESLREIYKPIKDSIEAVIDTYDTSEDERKKTKQTVDFIAEAILFYFSNPHKKLVDEKLLSITEEA